MGLALEEGGILFLDFNKEEEPSASGRVLSDTFAQVFSDAIGFAIRVGAFSDDPDSGGLLEDGFSANGVGSFDLRSSLVRV